MPTAIFNLVGLVQQRAVDRPNNPAYVFLSGGDLRQTMLTYGQLDLQARTIAAFLQRLEVRGERVLLLYPSGLEFIAAFLGCLYAGAIAVPAYPPRMNRNALRLVAIAEDSQASLALTTTAVASRFDAFRIQTPELGKMRCVATDNLELAIANDWRDLLPAEEDVAYLQYTSGSTAIPRGVMVTHANVLHNSAYIAQGFEHTPESVSLCWLPHFHDMGLIDGIIQPLYSGFTGYLMSPASFLQEPIRWLEAVSKYRVTHSGGPNFAYDLCSTRVSAEQRERLDLSSWKVAYNGAEPVHARTMESFARQFSPCGFRSNAFYPAYGLAEATLKVSGGKRGCGPVYCTAKKAKLEQNQVEITHPDDPEGRILVGAGSATRDVKSVIVNPKSYLECTAGEVGEIWISGPSVAAGYWNRPEETEQVFAAMKRSGEGPFLRTGDLGFRHAGELFVTGRLKDLIIIRGRNHYPQDIEATVQLSHPVLCGMSSAAFAVTVGTEERLVLVQEISPRQTDLFSEITAGIRRAVIEEHEIQLHAILLLNPGSVPRTSSGKVPRHLCRQMFLDRSFKALAEWREPDWETRQDDVIVPPELTSDSVQTWLRTTLATKLRRDVSEVNLHQPIYEFGLDSLAALEISHSVETALGISIPQSSLLEGWSIVRLAHHILSQLDLPSAFGLGAGVANSQAAHQYALSQGQQALWFLQQLAPESRAYYIARPLCLKGEVDAAALQRAFQRLVSRHTSLRVVFSVVDGRPMHHVHEQATVCFIHEDASRWDETTLEQRLREAANQPFDLSRGPLFRAFLFSHSNCDHLLLLTVHHMVADLWSLGLLLRELSEIYTAQIRNASATLGSLSAHYADYVNWEERFLAGEEGERHWRYWQEQLQGDLPNLDLPADFPRPQAQTYKGAVKFAVFDSELVGKLKSTAVNYNTTLYTLLIALFKTFLHRYTGEEDMLIGTPTTGRNRREFAGTVGYFVNPVVLRTDFAGGPTFEEIIIRSRRVVLEALEHQAFPFAILVQRLQPQRDPSRSPLFQVMFVFQKTSLAPEEDLAALALGASGTQIRMGDLVLESAPMAQSIAQFDLTLAMAETTQGLVASFEYNTDLFEEATVDRMMGHFDRLVREGIANPLQSISELPLLTDEESRQVLAQWNETGRKYPPHETVLELLEEQARKTPENPAVVFEVRRLSYRELHQRTNQLARFLNSMGVGPEVPVGVCMERSTHLVTALLGILKAGGAYVPLDPSYPSERLNYILNDVQVEVLLISSDLKEKLKGVGARLVCMDEEWNAISAESTEPIQSSARGENLAYVIYTSGSTGQPKGVMNVHRGLLNRLLWMQEAYALDESDRVLQKTPFGFDVSVWELFWPLMYGACLVVARPEGHRDSGYLVRTMQQERITTVHFVPSMLQAFLQDPGIEACTSLRRVICSGEALPLNLVHSFYKRSQADLHNLYGPTEASIDVSFWACLRQMERPNVPIGRPIANTQLYILDSHLQPVPVGVTGKLYIAGVGLARGYWRRPELTAEKFIPDPFTNRAGERLYHTGDLARWYGDGNIEYAGRSDDQIKLRGFRIELGEIEVVLAQHQAVQQAAVAVQEDAGQKKNLIAYVVPVSEGQLSEKALRSYMQERLPGYMIPSAFVELPALPLSANGKINRKALPRWKFLAAGSEYQQPRNVTEELLARVWSEVLGVERISIHDNFFELGGHSLVATQVMSRVREMFLVDLPLQAMFEAPTIAGLSEKIDRSKGGGLFAPIPISHEECHGKAPLSFAQERMWFLHQIIPDKSAYNIIEGVRLTGYLNSAALNASLQEIIRRHDILRASFVAVEGQCVQRIAATLAWQLETRDQSTHDSEEVRRLVREETEKIFDMGRAPLFRATLLKSAGQEHILLLAMHHIISDGWSFGVLLRELKELYRACVKEEGVSLPELPIQYADYAEWQRQNLKGDVLESELAYWRVQLTRAPSQLPLPSDHARPATQSFRGKRYSFELSKNLSDKVKELSRHQSVTPFMTLLSALKILLARYTRQQDIVVGSVAANRNHREIEGLIGLFANTLVLRTELRPWSSAVNVLRSVREVCVSAYIHQELPFEKLVAELEPQRDFGRTPLFQVMFAWQSLPLQSWQMEGLNLKRLPVEEESNTAKFDLSFLIGETQDGLLGTIEYSSDLFEADTIRRMFTHYQRILEEIARNSAQNVWGLPLLSEAERQQVLVEWNRTRQEFPQDRTVVQMIERWAALQPEALAVRDRKQEWSYQELNQLGNQWAHHLRKTGVQAESRVAICMQRSVEMIAAQLGVLKAAAAYIPLDREHPAERLQYQISDSGARVVITDSNSREMLKGLEQVWILCVDDQREALRSESGANPGWNVEPEQLAYVIYTSGSTGRPKGVEIEHRGLLNLVQWHQQRYGITRGERGSQVAGVGFDASVWEIWPYLAGGASLEIAAEEERVSASKLCEWLTEREVTIAFLPTPLAEAVMRFEDWKPQQLKKILTGGDRLRERPPESWDAEVVNHYGSTECTVVATAAAVKKREAGLPTIGRPISNTLAYILDEVMQPMPVGIVGELYLGGAGLARGYAGNVELTSERFVPDGLSGEAGERLYRTGDQCRWNPEGELEFVGRKDQQVKIRRNRIEVGEVEAMLKEYDGIRDAVVAEQENESRGKLLVAYVVTTAGREFDASDLRQYLQSRVPIYMVPSAFMRVDAIPLTSSGRLDRQALKRWEFTAGSGQQDPRNETEALLAKIWTELLRLERVGIHDSFFKLGGDSIISLQVVARAQQQGIRITPQQLFESPTIAALVGVAERVEDGRTQTTAQDIGETEALMYPLSPTQKGMLFEYLSAHESGIYIQQLICTVRGRLNIEGFQNAWQQVVERHSILRTVFTWDDQEEPLQVVRLKADVPFEFQDWSGISESEQQRQLQSLLAADRVRGFSLSEAPLLRFTLLQIAPDLYQWLFTFHHLILDGWSLPLLFREVFARYGEQIGGEPDQALPDVPYSDYIQWFHRRDFSIAETYWRQTLQGFEAPTRIALPSIKHFSDSGNVFFEQQVQLSSEQTGRLQSTAKSQGITLSILVQAAWAILLSRYTGEQDIVFGLTLSGRSANLPGIETMIGLFINTLPVRACAEPRQPVLSWVKELQARQVELTHYEHTPLSQVQKWSDIPAGTPLFESIVVFENYPLDGSLLHQSNGLAIENVEAIEVTNYPLTVTMVPHSDLRLLISYDRRRFDDGSIARMLRHLETIVLSMAASPHQLIRDVTWITPPERSQVLVDWNQTSAGHSPQEYVHTIFEDQAKRCPGEVAVTFGTQQMTYAELDQRANGLASYLRKMGVTQETYVGFCAERSMEMVIGVLGILKAGGVYTPIDRSWPALRKALVLTETQALLLLTSRRLLGGVAEFDGQVICMDTEWEQISRQEAYRPAAQINPDSLAYVIYTSGTTGKPKGVTVSHRALCNHLRWIQAAFPLTPQDRVPQKYSMSFDVSILEIFYPLFAGARLVVAPPMDYFDSASMMDFLVENKITAIDLVPSMLQVLVQDQRFSSLTGLRQITCGGDVLPNDLLKDFFASSTAELANLYGPTEATIGSTFWRCCREEQHRPVSIGRPIRNTQVYVLDLDMEPVPVGVAGELYIGGVGLARGYLHEPSLTAEKFVPYFYSQVPGERLYRTGDLGRYHDDGNIEYLGRADHQVKIRGFRIEPGEIEAAVRAHPAVRDVVVLVHEQQLVAYVAGVSADQNHLRQYLTECLPEYMLPARFVWLEKIPQLANGKVDRKALPAPKAGDATSRRDYVAPRNAMEADLTAIWSAVLKVERLSVGDNFFELGGDSIISLQVVARAQQQGIRIRPRQLFESPTIAVLAAVAERTEGGGRQISDQHEVKGEVALTPIQQWFFEQQFDDAHHYNQAVLLEAGEELNSEWLEAAWRKLVEHHDALRLRYRSEQGKWRQWSANREESRFFDVMEFKDKEEQRRTLKQVIEQMQKSLDLERGPLLRVTHVKPELLVVVIHHLAVDGVSWRIMLEDLDSAYRQLKRGEEIGLAAKTTSFQTWADKLLRATEAGRYDGELEHWFGEWQTVERMPRDSDGGKNREADRDCIKVELDEEKTRQLLQDVPGIYHTQINDVLLAAVIGSWEKWTKKPRLLIDVEGHGREGMDQGTDVSRTVGWFTAVYPVRLVAEKGDGIGERLKRIKEQLRKVPGQGIGYGALRYIHKDRGIAERLARQASAEISFNYLGQVDAALPERGLFKSVKPLEWNSRGANNRRSHLLEVEGRVQEGQLQVQWIYSQEIHRRTTVEVLAKNFVAELVEIIQHCLAPGVGGFTPSDFPLTHLDQYALDLLVKNNHSISDIYPFSPIQQGLLFHTLYDGSHAGTYVEQLSCTLWGHVSPQVFENAWQQTIDYHPALRTSFAWEGLQEPLQIVHQSVKAHFAHYDWTQSPADRQQLLEELLDAEMKQGFDLSNAPLMRFTLAQVATGRFEFIWSSHHLLLDGWSMSLIVQEVLERYASMCRGTSFKAASHRLYRDYIAWIQKQDLARAREYWQTLLKGFTTATPVPGEGPSQSLIADKQNLQMGLSAETTARLQTISSQRQITLSVLVQAAWALLLKHYTAERDLVFGITLSGRPAELAGIDRMVGVFINTLPLRVNLPSDATMFSVLEELQERQLQLNEYAYTPLSSIQEWSEIPPGQPLFETIVVFENYPVDASLREPKGELRFSNVRSRASSNYPLTLVVKPGDELVLQFIYESRRFESGMIAQLLAHLENLLLNLAVDPMQSVIDVQMISQAERQQLLLDWNRTAREYPRALGIQQLFEEQVNRAPRNTAVIFQDQKLSYTELNRRANQMAHYLRRQGVGPEVRVGLCMERSLELIVAVLGIVKAGGVYVALDAGSPQERLHMMLSESRVRLVLSQQHLRDRLPESTPVQIVYVDEETERLAGEGYENPGVMVSGEHLAYVSYTSGSTGRPKGVSVPHQAVVRLVKNNDYALLGAEETILQFAPLAFDASTLEIWGSLLNGGRLVVMAAGPRSAEEIGQALVEYGVTTLWLTAGLFHVMVDGQLEKLKQVRQVLAGGDVLPAMHVNRYLEAIGEDRVLVNGYGPTENATFTCCHRMMKGEMVKGAVPIGRPIGNTQVYVLGEEMQPVAVGVIGELYIGGAGLARGYENDAALTAERFIPHPSGKKGERLYRSGDEVRYRADGVLEFIGRRDRQVKVRGYRVELGEIESALMQHEEIREAVVTLQDRESGDKSLVAYVVMQPGQKFSSSNLRSYLKSKLPDYMNPSIFIPLEKLLLTSNGKVDYKALPKPETSAVPNAVILPRTPVEHAMAEIWSQVLGIQKLSIHDNFFHLGGHSLLALQIASRVRIILRVALPVRNIFEGPTIAEQARAVEGLLGTENAMVSDEILPVPRPENLPLSFSQQRLWFLYQLEPTSDFYNVPVALHIRGPLNVNILNDCCAEIVRRHEVLRTTFPIRQGGPVQQIEEAVYPLLTVADLGNLPLEQAETAVRELLSREAQRPFDLSRGPLLRLTLARLGKDDHVLLLNIHHIVVDGWSLGIFMRELALLYEAYLAGRSSHLLPLPIQYADYALWQREELTGERLEGELTWWRQRLSGAPVLDLPTDYPRPKVQTFRGAKKSILLAPHLLDLLKSLARRENSTVFMTLLAVLKVLLYRYTSQPDISVGTPVAGRNQQELEPLIGFFVNTLVLRTQASADLPFTEFLHQVRDVSLIAFAHQDMPFDKLVEDLHPQRSTGHTPFFQVMFALEDTLLQEVVLPGLQVSPVEVESQTAKFDLTITIRESSEGLPISFQYNSDLFEDTTIERMTRHFERLLCGIVANPMQQISQVPLLTDEERRQVLMEWNQTECEYPAHETVLELLEEQARKTPENPAVVFEGRSVTYRELHQQANQVAHFLKELGVGPEVPVGVCMERSTQLTIALLGILKAGAAYVPLDPSHPAERLSYMLNDARVGVLLADDCSAEKLKSQNVSARLVCLEKKWNAISKGSGEALKSGVVGENLAYVIYTSGSTGQPKGVMNVHCGLLNRLEWMQEVYRLDQSDRVLQKTPFGFDVSVWEFFWPLMYGACLVVARAEGHKDSRYLVETIQQEKITTLHFVPSMLQMFLQETGVEGCTTLRRVICSGEALVAQLVQDFHNRLSAELHNLYGPTEASIDVSFWACPRQMERASVPIGQPIANTRLYVLDSDLEPVPAGVNGELYIGGVGLARGYWRRAELTAEKFIPDLFSSKTGERLYRTGDLARWRADGQLEYLGRIDNQVKLRGYRIELGEIEELLRQHPEVSQAVVVLRTDGSKEKRLVGYIVTQNETDKLPVQNIREYMKKKVPEYMIPMIVQMNKIPLTVNGKIDYDVLLAFPPTGLSATGLYVAPRNAIEEQIAKACCGLLNIQRLGVDDNFFDLGGHSLLAMRLMTWVRETFQVEAVPLRGFFETPTIAGLAALTVACEPRPGQTEKIATFLQQLDAMSPQEVMTFRTKNKVNEAAQNVKNSGSSL